MAATASSPRVIFRAWGYPTSVHLLGERGALRADAAHMAGLWGGDIAPAETFSPEGADLVIDALYGAGLSRDVDGLAAQCVARINASGAKVLAVDVPSGLDGETGAVRGVAVAASATVTFFRLKPGHLLSSGGGQPGRLWLADIGIPEAVLVEIGAQAFANQPRLWREALPRISAHSHKYTRGAALVLSGEAHRTGAARLAARAALRIGAGLVTLACPRDAAAVVAGHETAVMVAPFEDEAGFAGLLADTRRNADPDRPRRRRRRSHPGACPCGARRAARARARARRRCVDQLRRRAGGAGEATGARSSSPRTRANSRACSAGGPKSPAPLASWPERGRPHARWAPSWCSRAPTPSSPRRMAAPR